MVNARQRLVHHVQQLEHLEALKRLAAEELKDGFEKAKAEGYDTATLKVVLKLRKMTPDQRRERRALEAIYMASLGMLEGDPLTDEARRRLDGSTDDSQSEPSSNADAPHEAKDPEPTPERPEQPPLIVKDPEEARTEGADAASAGKRIFDNPYAAGNPCRAAWDEGWCAQQKSHGMETPAAYQRRSAKQPDQDDKRDKDHGPGDLEKGAA